MVYLYKLIYNTTCEWGDSDKMYYVIRYGNLLSYSLKFYNWEELKLTYWLDNSQIMYRTLCVLGAYIDEDCTN